MNFRAFGFGFCVAITVPGAAFAQAAPTPPEVDACKASGLIALKEQSPTVKDIDLDLDSLRIIKTTAKIEDTPIRAVILGEVYVEKGRTGKPQNLVCIVGEKGKVLLTLFTDH